MKYYLVYMFGSLTRFFIISWLLFFRLSIKRTASHLFATATNFDSSSAENIYILRDSQSAIFPSGNNNIGRCWVSEKSKSWEPTSPIEMVSAQQHCTRTRSVPFNKNHNQARRMPPKWSILWSTNHLWFEVDAIKAITIQEHFEYLVHPERFFYFNFLIYYFNNNLWI